MERYCLYVCNLPSGYGLFAVYQLIDALLNDSNDLGGIDFVKNEDGSSDDSTAEVRLRTRECFNSLLQQAVIALRYEDRTYALRITDKPPTAHVENDGRNADPIASHHDSVVQEASPETFRISPTPPKPRPRKYKPPATQKFSQQFLDDTEVVGHTSDHYSTGVLPTVTWHDILQTDPKLMQGDPYRAVLVQSASKNMSEAVLGTYFIKEGFCRSGRIEKIFKLNDGMLIIFSHVEIATLVLNASNHVIDNDKVKVFRKVIPSIFDNGFIIEGVFPDDTMIENVLECCDVETDTPHKIIELDQQPKFLVKYEDQVAVDELIAAIEKIPLEENKIQTKYECHTDCIKVENLHDGITNDSIRLTFMNRKSGCTGKVTKVHKVVQGEELLVFVYFANFGDAESVVNTSTRSEITVSGVAVQVSLYHHSMSNDHQVAEAWMPHFTRHVEQKAPVSLPARETTSARRLVKPFEYTPKVKEGVMEYIQHFAEVEQQLKQKLKHMADVSILVKSSVRNESTTIICVKPALQFMSREYKYNQSKFRSECSSLLTTFLNKFTTTSATYDDKSLSDVRRSLSWNDDNGFINVKVDDNKFFDVYVRWNNLSPGHVTITGWGGDVAEVVQYIRQKCDVCEEFLSFKESIFRAIMECKAVAKIKEEFRSAVKITDDAKTLTLIFKGQKGEVARAKSRMSDIELELITRVVPDIGNISKFLSASLRNDKSGKTDTDGLRDNIQAQFASENICASLQFLGDQVCLLYIKQSEMGRAQKSLMEMIKQRTIQVSGGFDELVNSAEWKRLTLRYNSTGSVQIFTEKESSTITVVGLSYTIQETFRRIDEHVKVNASVMSLLEPSYVVVQYFSEHKNLFADESRKFLDKVNVKWKLDRDKAAIAIEGKTKDIEKASQWFQRKIDNFCIKIHKVNDPGVPEYFRSEKGRKELVLIAGMYSCIGIVDPPEWKTKIIRTSLTQQLKLGSKPIVQVTVPHTQNVTLRLVQNDITESDCDVMVNASNEELELRPAGVSGSILNKGGRAIQEEMTSYVSRNGKLRPGFVTTTSAGTLRFKTMIHTVGPTWKPNSVFENKRDLKKCVKNSLQEASLYNLKSIAIPAISCGVFGGKPDVCVPLMVEAAVDFVQENDESTIKQIDFVEMSNSKIIDEFTKALRNASRAEMEEPVRQKTYTAGDTFNDLSFKPKIRSEDEPNLPVSVCKGDISAFKASVLVTSIAPGLVQSGRATAVSQALYKQAGPKLEAASKATITSTNPKAGDVICTPGFNLNCNEVYHVVLVDYDPNVGGKILAKAIQTCLSWAESSSWSSIAFPVLGGGGFGYPPGLVMQTLHDVVQRFAGRSLRKVTLVIFPSDDASLQASQNEFSFSIPSQTNQRSTSQSRNSLRISVKNGDLLSSKCNVIVNSASRFDLRGQVGKLIVARGGQNIADECANNPIRSSAWYRVTSAGKLPSKYIIHVDTPKDANQLVSVLCEVLKVADELSMKSIAIPAIGSGSIGMASDVIAKSMRRAFDAFDKRNPKYLHDIEVWIFQQNMMADFQQHVLGGGQPASVIQPTKGQSMFRKMKEFFSSSSETSDVTRKPASLFRKAGSNVDKPSVSILLCSYKEENVAQARKSIDAKVKELTLTKKVEDKALNAMTTSEEFELLAIGRKHNVTIQPVTDQRFNDTTAVVISGLNQNVYEAHKAVAELIHQINKALLCSQYVMWKYKNRRGKMQEFPLRASSELEEAYQKNKKGSLRLDIFVTKPNQSFTIDFNRMEETCHADGKKTKVERCTVSGTEDPLPANWEDMGKQPWKKVTVKQNSSEFSEVMQKFNASTNFNAVKLERIQNPTLYKQYQAQKKKVTNRLHYNGSKRRVERRLFHGTSVDACVNIFKDGFDRSYAGKHGTWHGRGVYFATTALYSNKFTSPDKQGYKRMFLANVITGEYCQGKPDMNFAPLQNNNSPYDSVVNDFSNPTQYVIFKDPSVYPSYMLTFT